MQRAPFEQVEKGKVYRLRSRNLVVGVLDGKDGYIGDREKFGARFLATEYDWDTGPPHGTATPLASIGVVPEGIPIVERLPGDDCLSCHGVACCCYVEYAEPIDVGGRRVAGRWVCMECVNPRPVARANRELFGFLEPLDDAETDRTGWSTH